MLDPMAISGYLGWFLAILLSYPLVLVGVQLAIFSEQKRKRVTFWFNIGIAAVLLILFYFHMQTEVIYGKSLLDAWYAQNPKE
ncbi:hypothetical protein TUMSATVNIG1_49520 [Vibrio nigripulchritudo]|uniref:hypothetical protein n=1 Tax=Vibrio nigripulchritudo TaxID=28173 RepID=UPI00190BAED6|nr:hypothetical protein [Vibrio nigripulchritudo]BCL72979.1 hypothetical protein VNTUMSATTG_49160 [Vibrio nigripulchritudo]BDU34343.1 hypothetical protein TUMSATVNIG1_49520 [Vibrio nigripulchritudo]